MDGKQGAQTWDRLNKNDHRRPKRCGGILFGRCFRAPTPLRLRQIIYHPLSLLLNVVAVYTTLNGLSLRKYVEFRDNNGQEGPPRNGCCFKLLPFSCVADGWSGFAPTVLAPSIHPKLERTKTRSQGRGLTLRFVPATWNLK